MLDWQQGEGGGGGDWGGGDSVDPVVTRLVQGGVELILSVLGVDCLWDGGSPSAARTSGIQGGSVRQQKLRAAGLCLLRYKEAFTRADWEVVDRIVKQLPGAQSQSQCPPQGALTAAEKDGGKEWATGRGMCDSDAGEEEGMADGAEGEGEVVTGGGDCVGGGGAFEGKSLKSCEWCRITRTPLWRNGPPGRKVLCNACGIRWYKLKKAMVQVLEKADVPSAPSTPVRSATPRPGMSRGKNCNSSRKRFAKLDLDAEAGGKKGHGPAPCNLQLLELPAPWNKRSRSSLPSSLSLPQHPPWGEDHEFPAPAPKRSRYSPRSTTQWEDVQRERIEREREDGVSSGDEKDGEAPSYSGSSSGNSCLTGRGRRTGSPAWTSRLSMEDRSSLLRATLSEMKEIKVEMERKFEMEETEAAVLLMMLHQGGALADGVTCEWN